MSDGDVVTGGGNPAEGGNYIIQVFDVRRAVHKLDPMDQLVLQMKYYENHNFTEMAELLQCSDTTAHRRVTGALRRLHFSLGGDNPFGKGEERVNTFTMPTATPRSARLRTRATWSRFGIE